MRLRSGGVAALSRVLVPVPQETGMTPGPYHVGSGNRSTDYTVTGPGMKVEICSGGGRDMEGVADWVAEHMNVAFKAGKAAATQ